MTWKIPNCLLQLQRCSFCHLMTFSRKKRIYVITDSDDDDLWWFCLWWFCPSMNLLTDILSMQWWFVIHSLFVPPLCFERQKIWNVFFLFSLIMFTILSGQTFLISFKTWPNKQRQILSYTCLSMELECWPFLYKFVCLFFDIVWWFDYCMQRIPLGNKF